MSRALAQHFAEPPEDEPQDDEPCPMCDGTGDSIDGDGAPCECWGGTGRWGS